jgi:hypothetical protein
MGKSTSEIGRITLSTNTTADQKRTEAGDANEPTMQTKGLIAASSGSAKPLCVGSIPTRASISLQ